MAVALGVGDLNRRITIQQISSSISAGNSNSNGFTENGFQKDNWLEVRTVWAAITNSIVTQTTTFTIRYFEGVTEDMRILFNNKQYKIEFIDNINFRNAYLKIKAVEVLV